MDPVAHTLVGAALAETGLKRLSRYATATLLIAANLPDIDAVAGFWGRDVALYFRRGWSHGVLALVLLPLLLAAAVWLWHRWRGRAADDGPPFRPRAILALSAVGVWSHPLLDWLNTYGVRLLMPFDGRWFYGDTLFIVDPWVWLLAAAGVVVARPWNRWATLAWIGLAGLATAFILDSGVASPGIAVTWLAGLTALPVLRWRMRASTQALPLAQAGLATLVLYICVVYGIARVAESMAAGRFAAPLEVQSNPVPGRPASHRLVLVYDDFYRIVTADGEVHALRREPPDRIVQAALASPAIRGFANWMRFPYWQVEEQPDHWVVRFWDLRYQSPVEPQARGIGGVEVQVTKAALQPGSP
ncbi:MAG TPA: metal-dependent hydrolase [Ramlibacter sp.]|nr:metal-dependent hydrolase [Ramlibacter sp.]